MAATKVVFLVAQVFLLNTDDGAHARPQISLEYKPQRPFYHPRPGDLITQIVPPGEPWPANAAGYANFSQTRPPLDLDSRFKEKTTTARPPLPPNPGDRVGQIVPSGQLWPSSSDGYANFSQTTAVPNLTGDAVWSAVPPKPGDRVGQIVPAGQPWPGNVGGYANFSVTSTVPTRPISGDRFTSTSGRPSFHPNPGDNVAQIVPPGQPWPSNAEDYANFSQTSTNRPRPELEDRFKETTSTTGRPSFHPNPGDNVAQIVPPGQPWPGNVEDYANFSQTSTNRPKPNLDDRIKETTSTPSRPSFHPNPGDNVAQIVPPGQPWPSNVGDYANFSQTSTDRPRPDLVDRIKETTSTPSRPSFHPNPGNNVAQIIPPGQPWPSNVGDYANFSQTSTNRPRPDLVDRIKETTSTTSRPSFQPNPGNNVAQIVSPGRQWPSNFGNYASFSQTTTKPCRPNRPRPNTILPLLHSANFTTVQTTPPVPRRVETTTKFVPSAGSTKKSEKASTPAFAVEPVLLGDGNLYTSAIKKVTESTKWTKSATSAVPKTEPPTTPSPAAIKTERVTPPPRATTATETPAVSKTELPTTVASGSQSPIVVENELPRGQVPAVSNLLPIGSEAIFDSTQTRMGNPQRQELVRNREDLRPARMMFPGFEPFNLIPPRYFGQFEPVIRRPYF